jgi:hypothetical protein
MNAKELYGESKEESICEFAKWPEYDTKSNPKVLFMLKEPSTRNNEGKEYNFKKQLGKQAIFKGSRMWKLLACCSEMFQMIFKGQSPEFSDLYVISDNNKLHEMLYKSSFTNLKRLGCKPKSCMERVGVHAGLFWQLIIEEIKEIKPDIIICAGTFEIISELLDCLSKIPDYVKKNGYCSIGEFDKKNGIWKCKELIGKEIRMVEMCHPAYLRKAPNKYFNELKDIATRIKPNILAKNDN